MHLYYFTRGTLPRMLDEAGSEVLTIERAKRIVSLGYFLEKAAAVLGAVGPLLRLAALPFGGLYVTVDFGDNMMVIAKKAAPRAG